VLVDDLINIFFIHIGVPHAFGVDGDHGPLLAAIHAASVVDAAQTRCGEFERLNALLRVIAHRLGVLVGTAGATIIALINTKKDVVLVIRGHGECDEEQRRHYNPQEIVGLCALFHRRIQLIVFSIMASRFFHRVFCSVNLNFIEGGLQRVNPQNIG